MMGKEPRRQTKMALCSDPTDECHSLQSPTYARHNLGAPHTVAEENYLGVIVQ